MGGVIVVYFLIVTAHVYYRHYFANKIIYDVKRDIVRKILQIQGNCSEKEALNVLTYDVRNFADMVIFVPNQIFLIILSAIFTFIGLNKARDNVLGWGSAYSLLIALTCLVLDYLLYQKDLLFQKQLEKQTKKENVLINNQRNDIQNNLIIKEPITVISFQEVSFAYEPNNLVLTKISYQFQKGQLNYLTGANGFGKSTIISLLIGLYKPFAGKIIINHNYQLSDLNLNA
ncbi:17787_t:CDS:2, partial [Racocetra fulgida]